VAFGTVDGVARARGAQPVKIARCERLGRESLNDFAVERGHGQTAALGADEHRRLACPQHDSGRLLCFNQCEQSVDASHV
jgi:hypothetical protein